MGKNPEVRRNVALIGQGGVGKTSLAEKLVFLAHATTRIGKTTEGSSHFDFEPEEIKRGTTLKTSVFDFEYKNTSFSLIDTPGSSSFLCDTICAMRAADIALLIVSCTSGLKVQGEKGWHAAASEGIARAIFANELDRERASLEIAVEAVKKSLKISPVVVQIPIGSEANLAGVIDLLSMRAFLTDSEGKTTVEDIPQEERKAASEARTSMIESIAETDDALVEKYLEGQEISNEELTRALKSGIAAGRVVPLLCGSAETGVGVEALLSAIADSFPSPLERVPFKSLVDDAEGADISPASREEFAGIVFKTIADPYTGQISLLRIVSGELSSDETVLNSNCDTSERVGKLHLQTGKEQKAVESAGPGSIVAIAKLKATKTGHTLCASQKPVRLAGFAFPESCISYAIEPKSRGDEDKIFAAVEKISVEDPAIRVTRDSSTKETLISGMGQNHIEITLERIKRKFNVEVILKAPQVPYRETIKRKAEAQGRHKKQSGGRGQFGDCWLRIAPRERGSGFEFKNEIFGGSIPRNYIPAVEKGVVEAMARGFLAGYPLVDLECSVYDGSYHSVDSSDLAFKIAASKGFQLALEKAEVVLLEPIMEAEIVVPDDVTGDIIGDLNGRRGKVLNMGAHGDYQVIKAEVPLAEMLTYAPDLRSISADRGSFHMEFRGYEEVPAHIAQKVIKESDFKKEEEE